MAPLGVSYYVTARDPRSAQNLARAEAKRKGQRNAATARVLHCEIVSERVSGTEWEVVLQDGDTRLPDPT